MTAPPTVPVLSERSDVELLDEFARSRSDAAFGEIVARYVNLVHSAALRHAHDPHVAEDVTQAVFLIFSQRAATLREGTILAGWFLLTARNVARNALRQESRLKRREQRAAAMQSELDPALPPDAKLVVPLLDDALAKLGEVDRNVILQRFYLAKSHRDVGVALGMSEEAATKRANRALAKLRQLLERSGVTAAEATLASALPLMAAKSASPALVSAIHATVAAAGASSPGVAALAQAAAKPAVSWLAVWISSFAAAAVIGGVVYKTVMYLHRDAGAPTAVAIATPAAGQRTMTLLVKDPKTDAPVTGAKIDVQASTPRGGGTGPWVAARSDNDGRLTFRVPDEFSWMRATISAPGRAAMTITWNNYELRGGLPPVFEIPLETGTAIGGIVKDSEGKPVSGARVSVYRRSNRDGDTPGFTMADDKVYTDAEGCWRFDGAPSDLADVYVNVEHPTLRAATVSSDSSPEKLKALTAVTTVSIGKGVAGVITDEAGNPVAGANVLAGYSIYSTGTQNMATDGEGRFNFDSVGPHDRLTITARGYGPEMVDLPDNREPRPMQIKLQPARTLVADVAWPDGTPVVGASVSLHMWRNRQVIKWSTKSDQHGRFTWNDAPADPVTFTISSKKPSAQRTAVLTAAGEQQSAKVQFFPPVNASGTVVDADTKEPIKQFVMTYGIQWTGQNSPSFQTQSARTIADGKYQATLTQVDDGAQLKVEADGYLPTVSRMIQPGEGNVTINFELKKGSGPTGTLVDAEGNPVRDAKVYLVPDGKYFYFSNQNHSVNDDIGQSVTDKAGQFKFRPVERGYQVIAMTDTGMARVTSKQFAESSTIKLQPFGRIEGTIRIGTKPAANVTVAAQLFQMVDDNQGRIHIERSGTSDADGHFVVEKVPPRKVQLFRLVPVTSNSTAYQSLGDYQVEPGKTLSVACGGAGRPVVGKLTAPPGSSQPMDFQRNPAFFNARPKQPEGLAGLISRVAGSQGQAEQKSILFQVEADGTIRAEDVPPGEYVIDGNVQEPYDQSGRAPKLLARLNRAFTVPAEPKCPTDEPLDLGTIQLKAP